MTRRTFAAIAVALVIGAFSSVGQPDRVLYDKARFSMAIFYVLDSL